MYLTEQEAMGQHVALRKTFDYFMEKRMEIESFLNRHNSRKFIFLGCGSSFMIAKSGDKLFSACAGTTASALAGGDYLIYDDFYEETIKDSIIVVLTRSGETSEIVRTVKKIKETYGNPVITICLKQENELTPYSDLNLILDWSFDKSVCQTRSVTTLYTAQLLLKAIYVNDDQALQSIKQTIDANEAYKENIRPALKAIAEKSWDNVIVLADGPISGLAEEGALAFTEISMLPGKWFNLLDYRHGPIVLNDSNTLTVVLISSRESKLQGDMMKDLKSHGGTIVTLSAEQENRYEVDAHICIGDAVMGIPFINAIQILALEKSLRLGNNPDAPKGLASFIAL